MLVGREVGAGHSQSAIQQRDGKDWQGRQWDNQAGRCQTGTGQGFMYKHNAIEVRTHTWKGQSQPHTLSPGAAEQPLNPPAWLRHAEIRLQG